MVGFEGPGRSRQRLYVPVLFTYESLLHEVPYDAHFHASHRRPRAPLTMARSTNGFAARQRLLPHKALLRRAAPLRPDDREELEAACRRIAEGRDYLAYAGSRGAEIDGTVICFATAWEAEEMQAWIAASGIETRPPPVPYAGPQLTVGRG